MGHILHQQSCLTFPTTVAVAIASERPSALPLPFDQKGDPD